MNMVCQPQFMPIEKVCSNFLHKSNVYDQIIIQNNKGEWPFKDVIDVPDLLSEKKTT